MKKIVTLFNLLLITMLSQFVLSCGVEHKADSKQTATLNPSKEKPLSPLSISTMSVIPTNSATSSERYPLIVSNHSDQSLKLKNVSIKGTQLNTTSLDDSIDIAACDVLKAQSSCEISVLPKTKDGSMILSLTYQDKQNKKYSAAQIIEYSSELSEMDGFIVSNKYIDQTNSTTNYSLSIPFVTKDNFSQISVDSSSAVIESSISCKNGTNINSSCNITLSLLPNSSLGDNTEITINGRTSDGKNKSVKLFSRHNYNDAAHLIIAGGPLIINKAKDYKGNLIVVNVGAQSAKNIKQELKNKDSWDDGVSSDTADYLVMDTCPENELVPGGVCAIDFTAKNKTATGFAQYQLSYTNGISTNTNTANSIVYYTGDLKIGHAIITYDWILPSSGYPIKGNGTEVNPWEFFVATVDSKTIELKFSNTGDRGARKFNVDLNKLPSAIEYLQGDCPVYGSDFTLAAQQSCSVFFRIIAPDNAIFDSPNLANTTNPYINLEIPIKYDYEVGEKKIVSQNTNKFIRLNRTWANISISNVEYYANGYFNIYYEIDQLLESSDLTIKASSNSPAPLQSVKPAEEGCKAKGSKYECKILVSYTFGANITPKDLLAIDFKLENKRFKGKDALIWSNSFSYLETKPSKNLSVRFVDFPSNAIFTNTSYGYAVEIKNNDPYTIKGLAILVSGKIYYSDCSNYLTPGESCRIKVYHSYTSDDIIDRGYSERYNSSYQLGRPRKRFAIRVFTDGNFQGITLEYRCESQNCFLLDDANNYDGIYDDILLTNKDAMIAYIDEETYYIDPEVVSLPLSNEWSIHPYNFSAVRYEYNKLSSMCNGSLFMATDRFKKSEYKIEGLANNSGDFFMNTDILNNPVIKYYLENFIDKIWVSWLTAYLNSLLHLPVVNSSDDLGETKFSVYLTNNKDQQKYKVNLEGSRCKNVDSELRCYKLNSAYFETCNVYLDQNDTYYIKLRILDEDNLYLPKGSYSGELNLATMAKATKRNYGDYALGRNFFQFNLVYDHK